MAMPVTTIVAGMVALTAMSPLAPQSVDSASAGTYWVGDDGWWGWVWPTGVHQPASIKGGSDR